MKINCENAHFHFHTPANISPDAMAAMERAMQAVGRADAAPENTETPPVQPGEYWPGQGGHYVCTLPAQHGLPARHLIVAPAEQDGLTWGPRDHDITGATSQIDGRANTRALVATEDHPAAKWASAYQRDGHSDFHLPSRLELFMCWMSTPKLFSNEGWYWSSSQCSRHYAWVQDFEYGNSYDGGKDTEFRARPVRWIQL